MANRATAQGKAAGRGRGFRPAGALVEGRVRKAGEARGFAVARLLTHWEEIAGADIAAVARPLEVSYARGGLGATLTLLTTGASAPLVQMQEARLRERINACYGYAAIARIRLTQTAPTGFAEPPPPDGPSAQEGATLAEGVADPTLRDALARLGANVLARSGRRAPPSSERP
jgi:hypothetical protein